MTSPIRDRVAAVLGREPSYLGRYELGDDSFVTLKIGEATEILDKLDAVQASHARAVEDMGDAVAARQKAEQELCKAKAHYQTLVDHAVRALEDTCRSGAGITESDPTWVASVVRCIAELLQKLDAQPESDIARRLATAEACISLLAQMPSEISKLVKRVAEIEGGAQ